MKLKNIFTNAGFFEPGLVINLEAGEETKNLLPNFDRGQTFVGHWRQPIGQDGEDVGLHESHLQVGFTKLGHHDLFKKKKTFISMIKAFL